MSLAVPPLRRTRTHAARWVRIIPATIVVYIVAYMDRVNIGFAMAGGMNEALHLSLLTSGIAAGIFFLGYLVLQLPGGHLAEHGSAKRFIQWSIVAWAGISFLTGFVRNGWELLSMRFLLGVAEGGAYPAILVLIGNWFPQEELGRANGLFLVSLPLSAAISNPLSGWVVANYSWRGLFFFEGLVALVLLFLWTPLISDRPEEAQWLTNEERAYLLRVLGDEKLAKAKAGSEGNPARSYVQLLNHPQLQLMVAIYLCYSTAAYGYLFWLPTIVKTSTRMNLTTVGWLSAAPLLASVVGVYWFGAWSDREGNRRRYCGMAMAGFGICFWSTTWFPAHLWLSYALLVVAGMFSKGMMSPFWSMPSLLFPPGVSGGARGIINGIGNMGGFAGPVLVGWLAHWTSSVQSSAAAVCAVSVAGAGISLLLPEATAGRRHTRQTGNLADIPK